jgi:Protein of unknown function (DUF4031)
MTVYVDNMKLRAKLFRWNGTWSNLYADTTKELIDFADELGLTRASMIDEGYVTERFMINEMRRREALRLGAVPISYEGAGRYKLLRRKRESGRWKEKEL